MIFPYQAQGSLIERDGKVIGSALIGQKFTSDKYFHGRPSATHGARPEGSDQDRARALQCREFRRLESRPVQQGADRPRARPTSKSCKKENPVGAGADRPGHDVGQRPRPATSRRRRRYFQVPRVAKARNLPEDRVRQLVEEHTEGRLLGLLGEPRVNVLALNLALDRAWPAG